MTDQPIPAAASVSGLSVSTQQSGSGLGRTLVTNAPVQNAPSALQDPAQPLRVQGTVISSNPQTQELRIATADGQVTVQSPANLPTDTQVILDLSLQKGVELATITVLRQQAQVSEDINQLAEPPASNPPPPLQAGDTMQAILLPLPEQEAAAPPAAIVAPPTLPQIAEMVQYLPPSALPQLPGPLPLPPQALIQLATAANILAALQQLPPAQQAQLAAFVARPDVAETLKRILPPEVAAPLDAPAAGEPEQNVAAPQAAAFQAPPEEEPLDENILQIVQAQTGARMTQEASSGTAAPALQNAAPLALLKGFLPLLETLQSQSAGAQYSGPGQSLFPAPAMPQTTPLADLMPKSMYEVKIIALTPPDARPLAPSPGALQGVVESLSPKGFPVVHAGSGLFVLKTLAQAPLGTGVTFEAKALTPEQAIATAATTADWFDPLTGTSWPALQETLQTITQSAPLLLPVLNNTLPTLSENLVPTALFFLAAVNTGNIENWLGPPLLDALKLSGKSALAQRLGADFARIGDQAKDSIPGDWRATALPLRHDADIGLLQLFVRQQRDNHHEEKQEEASSARPVTRFILNLRLSRLGDMQLDGLLHQKRFDLILRSAGTISAEMRQELRQHFQAGLRETDMSGDISFQAKSESWVNVALPLRGTSA